ncbi:MAG: hypothetical protein ACREM3_01320 [Candidatus Rokuibacteriota bacterium]
MHRVHALACHLGRVGGVMLGITLSLTACHSLRPRGDELPAPRIAPRPVPIRTPLALDRSKLPKGAGATLPAFDGDAFFVSIPPREAGELSARDVFAGVVLPVLQAAGFQRSPGELSVPPGAGTALPGADLAAVAAVTCQEVAGDRYRRYHPVCDAMRTGKASSTAERVFQIGDGMTFAQFKADLERPRIQYVYRQLVRDVPIEHTGVIAVRWEGETVTTVQGNVFNRYVVTNRVLLTPEQAVAAGEKALGKLKGVAGPDRERRAPRRPELLLLPHGSARDADGREVAGLRYAYRVLLFGLVQLPSTKRVERGSWLAWIDAETGQLLELAPQFDEVTALGKAWRRDPGTPAQLRGFQVDPAVGSQYVLEWNDAPNSVFNRIDRRGDADFDDGEVSISDSSGGSSSTLANVDQAPINDDASALCPAGGNNGFRQVHAMAHLHNFHQAVVGAGIVPTFPEAPVAVWVDFLGTDTNFSTYDFYGSGQSNLRFVNGSGFEHANCPDQPNLKLNGTQDATTLAHEIAHLSTKRQQERRPADWCGMATCPVPTSTARLLFHDFADHWANAYASTPCMGGWSNKNQGGAGVSANCAANHAEDQGLPRLTEVAVPFDAADPRDHFPGHRTLATGDYADGQIAGAALWLTRAGMRSKCLPSGTAQYWVRLNRALWNFGFVPTTCTTCAGNVCTACDRDIYRYTQDLMRQMTQQWATAGQPGGPPAFHHNGAHTTNKVLSGFARAGIFLTPYECIDGDATTGDDGGPNSLCPVADGGENGGDAVVDVDDNDTADDVLIDSIRHREVDYVRRAGGPPTFQVWTGPRHKFDGNGVATSFTPSAATPSPCNTQFQVEVASDETFTTNLVTSGFITVSATAAPQCFGTWTPGATDWNTLKGATGDTKIFYRVRTRNAAGSNEKLSTSPGNGLFTVPPAYVIANDLGTP